MSSPPQTILHFRNLTQQKKMYEQSLARLYSLCKEKLSSHPTFFERKITEGRKKIFFKRKIMERGEGKHPPLILVDRETVLENLVLVNTF